MGWLRHLLRKDKPEAGLERGPEKALEVPFHETVFRHHQDGHHPVPVELPPRPARKASQGLEDIGAVVAVDLGTSASAVATAIHAEGPPFYVHSGVLGEIDARLEDRVPLIGSELLGPLSAPGSRAAWYVLGRTGRYWLERLRGSKTNGLFTPAYYASVKRMLELSGRLDVVKYSLGGVFRELLLMALCPARSGTVRARYLIEQGHDDWAVPVPQEDLESYVARKQLGFPASVRRYLAGAVRRAGLELYVTVPNAFAFGEVDMMVQAARKAGADAMTAWGVRRSGLPDVHVLREAEAVACWHHHCLQPGSSPGASQRPPGEGSAWGPGEDQGAPATARVREAARPGVGEPPGSSSGGGANGGTAPALLAQQPGHATPRTGYWLVFDMGAGTTDLALVLVRERGYRLVHRSGLPVGGDDVDLLFVRHLARQPLREYFADVATGPRAVSFEEVAEHLSRAAQTPDPLRVGKTAALDEPPWVRLEDTLFLEGLDYRHRLALKRLACECKVLWSHAMRGHLGAPADPYLEEVFGLSDTVPDLADCREQADFGKYLLRAPGYRLLLYLVTRGCCQALLERTGPLPSPVDRVVVSGRAARLPLVAEALSYALEEAGYAHPDVTTYQWPLGSRDRSQPTTEVDSKLAVVRGAAWYGFRRWHHELPRGASNDIVMQTFLSREGETTLLFRQGEPLDAGGRARKLVAFDIREGSAGEDFRIRFFHQRLPVRLVEDLASGRPGTFEALANSAMCRRILADGFRPRVSHLLGIEIDEEQRKLELYAPLEREDLHRVELGPVSVPATRHPVTGLQEDWLWEGEGAHTSHIGPSRRHP